MYRVIALIAACFFFFILWMIYLANTGGQSVFFDFIRTVPNGDKLGHLGLFGFLTLCAIIGLRFRCFSCGKIKVYYGATIVSLFVIGEEISQAFIPTRTFDLTDLAADFIGIALAIGIAVIAQRYFVAKVT